MQVRGTLAVQRDRLAGLRSWPDVDVRRAVECLDLERCPERSRRHRDRQRAVQIIAVPLEDLMRALHDLQEQVTRRATAGANLALAGQLDVRAVLDSGGDPDLHSAPGTHPAIAVALGARAADDRAEPAARRARTRRHHLAEERPGDLTDLAPAVAHVARGRMGAGRGALTRARRAHHGSVNGEFPGRAEHALGQIEIDPDGGVATAAGAAPRASRGLAAAEEGVHDVAER